MRATCSRSGNFRDSGILDHVVPVEIDRSLGPDFEIVRALSVTIYQTNGVHTRKGTRTTVRLSLFLNLDRIGVPSSDPSTH